MNTKYNPQKPSDSYDKSDYQALLNSSIPASLAGVEGMRFDSAESASLFFARELDYIKAKTYDRQYPALTALTLFPVTSEVDIGAETVTWYGYEKVGFAKIVNDYSADFPRVDEIGEPNTSYIKSIGASYGYSVQDMRASRMAGKSLDVRKANNARQAIESEINRIAWSGDAANKLVGVLSPGNNIPLYTLASVPKGSGTSTKWVDKTPQQILADINGMVKFTADLTKSVEKPDNLVLPTEAYLHIAQTTMPDSEQTILSWLLANSPRIKNIVEAPELNADSGITPHPGQGVAFLYTKDPEKLAIEIPLTFFQHPIQAVKLMFEVPCEARVVGAVIYYPLSALIAVGV